MRRSRLNVLFAALCSTIALAVGLAVGGRCNPERHVEAEVRAHPTARIRLDKGLAERAGIRTAPVVRRTVSPTLSLVGSVDFDADRVAEVGARIPGRVARIYVRPGANVPRGAPLVEIESAALGDAVATYLSARANSAAARSNADREVDLAGERLTTARVLEQARAHASVLEAELRGAEQRLAAMGLGPAEIRALAEQAGATITLRAPLSGTIISRQVVLGQTVEPTTPIVRVADLDRLWVMLDVFEMDLGRVRMGDEVEIVADARPARILRGIVGHVDSVVDARTRTARVRIEVGNADRLLRPGQFVTARLRSQADAVRRAITIPRAAIVQIEGRPAAFVEVAPLEYEVRALDLGASEPDAAEVTRGLEENELLVTDGVFALKSELQR